MKVLKIMPKAAPYLLAGATMLGVATTRLTAANDSFEKQEPVTMVVEKEEAEDTTKKDLPWIDIASVGLLLTFLGMVFLGEHIDKKIDEKEAAKKQQTDAEQKN